MGIVQASAQTFTAPKHQFGCAREEWTTLAESKCHEIENVIKLFVELISTRDETM